MIPQEPAHIRISVLGPLRLRPEYIQPDLRLGRRHVLLGVSRGLPEPDGRQRVQRRLHGVYTNNIIMKYSIERKCTRSVSFSPEQTMLSAFFTRFSFGDVISL